MIGDVIVRLGEQDHVLRFRLRAWAAVEDRGFQLDQIMNEMQGGKLNFKAMEALLWAMLQHENPPPSIPQVGEWVGGDNFAEVVAKIGDAIRGAFPPANPPTPAPVTPGTGSGPAP